MGCCRKLQKAVTVNTSLTPSHPEVPHHGDQDSVKERLLRQRTREPHDWLFY